MHPAVRRLHHNLQALRHSRKELGQDKHELHKDQRALKKDVKDGKHAHKVLDRHHDALKKERKELDRAKTRLDKTVSAENQALSQIDSQKSALEQMYQDSFDPLTGMGDVGLQMQLAALAQQRADTQASFDGKVAERRAAVDKEHNVVDRRVDQVKDDRKTIHALRHEIKQDRREVKHDKHAVKHDRKEVKEDRHTALSHLRKAEYHMGLKATNRVRKELGLKAVDHVIRPGVPNIVGGKLGHWIAEAMTILKKHGVPMSKMDAHAIALVARHESGGNPNAQNNWDSNAAAGTPSIGLMQTIGPTFNAYKLPGHGNIRNPVDNIIAAVRYAIARYGSMSNVPGVVSIRHGGAYQPY